MANQVTEFCCRAGGSNLNAGTLRGDSTEPGTAASFTYASGNWDNSTGVFTPASGNPSSDGVAVGDYVSVYADGSTVTGFVGQVSAVDATTITVDLTDHFAGTAPTTGTGDRTLRVGGAWQGPNGAEGFPFDFVTETMCDGSDIIVRVNVKNDQTYSVTSTITLNSGLSWRVFQGYQTTYGDKNQALIQGPASGTSFTLLDLPYNTRSGNSLIDLHFDRNGDAAGANWGVQWGGGNSRNKVIRCRFSNMYSAGATFSRTEAIVQDCEFDNNGTYGAWHTLNGVYFYYNCRFHNNGSHGLFMTSSQNRYARAFGCIFANNGSHGASTAADSGSHYFNCIFYGNTSSGLMLSASQGSIVQNCAFIDNGAYGIYFTTTDQNYSFVQVYNCAFGSGTMANNSGNIRNGTGTSYDEAGTITEVADFDPYTDPANGDFTLKSGSVLALNGFNFTQPNANFDGTASSFPIGATGPPAVIAGGGGWTGSGSLSLETPDTEYYVDSENGSDSNTGLSEAQAWQTLAYAATTMTYGTVTRLNVKVRSTAYAANDWNPNNGTNNYLIVQGYTTSPGDGGKPTLQRTTGTYLITTGHGQGNIAFRHLRFEDGNCRVNAYHFAWYVQCDFHNASVTGSRSVREDYHYVVGCKFTSTGDMTFAADATCKYCLFDGSNMTGQSYMVSRGGPEISDCVFIIKDGCGGFGNSHNTESRLTRCLFLGDESGTGGRGGTGYEGNVYQATITTLTNCVFADLTTGIEGISYECELIGNNLFHNCGTNTGSITSKIKLPDFVATQHPVPNRASQDYRINVPASLSYASDLIPSTFGPAALSTDSSSGGGASNYSFFG